jgi:hypothetical protein
MRRETKGGGSQLASRNIRRLPASLRCVELLPTKSVHTNVGDVYDLKVVPGDTLDLIVFFRILDDPPNCKIAAHCIQRLRSFISIGGIKWDIIPGNLWENNAVVFVARDMET